MKPNGKDLSLNANQLATLLVIDQCCSALNTGVNQLAGGLGLRAESMPLARALESLMRDKEALLLEWSRSVVLAPAGALSVIDSSGKNH